jgi:hypothetical protein
MSGSLFRDDVCGGFLDLGLCLLEETKQPASRRSALASMPRLITLSHIDGPIKSVE